jgi:hypothetical protein
MEAAGWAVKLTSPLHLVPRLRMHEAIREFPFFAFVVMCLVKHTDICTIYASPKEDSPCTAVRYNICVAVVERYMPQYL